MSKFFPVIFTIALLGLLNTAYGDITRVFKCPCTFSVSREAVPSANKEGFDVLVQPISSFDRSLNSKESNVIEEHSSRNLGIRDAVHTASGYHSFKKMSIKEKGLFRVHIRHHTVRTENAEPDYNLDLHVSARPFICPVILRPDPPQLDPPSRILSDEPTLEDSVKQNARNPRIVGGLFISPTLRQYLAAIQVPCDNGDPRCFNLCTATILSSRWLMTAAHCAVTPGSRVLVNSRSNREVSSFTTVSRAIPHPDYDPNLETLAGFFDLALIETTEDMTTCCGANPRFMPVSDFFRPPRPGSFVRAAGYGAIGENTTAPVPEQGLLRQVDVPIVRFQRCLDAYGLLDRELQLCAGYFNDGECDSCFGDSGGPLVQYSEDGTPVLLGVTSFGAGCARTMAPGVYTRPAGHIEWIESTDVEFTLFNGRFSQVRRRCRRGQFLEFVPGEVSECTDCPIDQISNGGPTHQCQQCPGELLRDTRRGNRCSCRAVAGSGLVRGEPLCRSCQPGSASRVGAARCVKCRAGSYAPEIGMSECLPCPGARRGASECETEQPTASFEA